MDYNLYRYRGLKIKTEEEIPEAWKNLINEVDSFIIDFLNDYHIDVDLLYTTNVGILKVEGTSSKRVLWDISFWAMYLKYIEFVFWAEHECDADYKKTELTKNNVVNTPSKMKENILKHKNRLDANRLVFLPCIFEYLSYQFYNDATVSYMFALLRDNNMCSMPHEVSEELLQEYEEYLSNQLLLAKLFCAGHELYHLRALNPAGMNYETYSQRVLKNVVNFVESEEFFTQFNDNPKFVQAVGETVASLNTDDPLFDELYADAAALDLIDVLVNYSGGFGFNFNQFIISMRTAIENFYAFNTMTYD